MNFMIHAYIFSLASPVAVTQGEITSGRNFSLSDTGGSVSGTVRENGSNNPIENMRVWACEYTNGFCSSDDTTVTDGSYTITGLPPGNYRIWADCSGTSYLSESYNNAYNSNTATVVVVNQAQTTSGIDFSLEAGGATITGTITDAGSGLPIEGLKVDVTEYSSDFWIASAYTAV